MGGAEPSAREADLFLGLQGLMVRSHWQIKCQLQLGDEYGQEKGESGS